MLTAITKFIKSLKEHDSKIFDQDINHDSIKITLAVFMNNIIHADGKTSRQEYKKILGFFQQEFNIDEMQTTDLFDSINNHIDEFHAHLDMLKEALADNQQAKSKILEHLNHLIICDGCEDIEYNVFDRIKTFIL
jgi:uncharacterized tellurite resistance protein B-like protein